jgi:hypothetical protein
MSLSCRNCEQVLNASFTYCPACGQRTVSRRLHLSQILLDFWTQVTDIDKGLFTLIRDLAVRPGLVAKEFIAGKRKKHFNPLSFYLIVGTVLIASMNITQWLHAELSAPSVNSENSLPSSTDTMPGQDTTPSQPPSSNKVVGTAEDTYRSRSSAVLSARRQATTRFWAQNSDLVSIAAAPLLCIFFWIFYRSAGFNYTELLIACLYMIGFTNLVYALVVTPLSSMLSSLAPGRSIYILTGVFKLFEISYYTFFCFQLTHGVIVRPLLRAAIVSVLVAIFWMGLTFTVMTIYIRTGFGMDT